MRGIQTRKLNAPSRGNHTHAVECEGEKPVKVLCHKARLDSLASSDASNTLLAPTCPRCLTKLMRCS